MVTKMFKFNVYGIKKGFKMLITTAKEDTLEMVVKAMSKRFPGYTITAIRTIG